jgi:hypothetical protein
MGMKTMTVALVMPPVGSVMRKLNVRMSVLGINTKNTSQLRLGINVRISVRYFFMDG